MGWIKRKAAQPKPHDCETPWCRWNPPSGMLRPAPGAKSSGPRAPMRYVDPGPDYVYTGPKVPVGDPGDIWACDVCGQVWIMLPPPPHRGGGYSPRGNEWARVGRWLQRKHAPRYTCGCRIDKPQQCDELNGTLHGNLFPKVVEEWKRPDWVQTGPQYPRPPRGDAGEAHDD